MRRLLRELATNGNVKGDVTTLEDFSVIAKLQGAGRSVAQEEKNMLENRGSLSRNSGHCAYISFFGQLTI